MKDINIVIDSQTHKVQFPDNFLGLNAENLQGNINFTFTNGFVNGIARLELSIDCESGFIPNLQNTGDSYTLPILSSLLTSDNIVMQLVIEQTDLITYKLTTDTSINNQKTYYTRSGVEGEYVYTIVENPKVADIGTYYEAQIPIFKTHIFNMTVGESINAVNTIPDDYPTWIDTLNSLVGQVNAKIIEMNQALAEVDNLDITATKEDTTVTITITRKDGSQQVVTITDGKDGVGIEKIEKTGTNLLVDTYTIYYTDDSTSTFQVKNGRGIVSIDKTDTNILTDTYTITYNDNTTSTFYVVNGNGVESIVKIGTSGLIDTYRISYTNGEYYDYQVANGNGIDNIQKTDTTGLVDTYTITYTNGTTSTYVITNGNGISNIAKTSTVDNVDTYTIYYTNGTTSTFTVTNSTVTNQEFQELQRLVDYNALYANALIKMNNTGTNLTINDTAEAPMPMSLAPSELSQDGEPTPETPQDIHTISGDNEIDLVNSNLWDGNYIKAYVGGNAGNEFITRNTNANSIIIECLPNTTYTIKKFESSNQFKIADYPTYPQNNDLVNILYNSSASTERTITTNLDAHYLIVYLSNSSENATPKLSILRGSKVPTSYTPHQEQSLPLNLPVENLLPTSINDWEQGTIGTNGANSASTIRIRTIDYYPIKNDNDYFVSVQNSNYCFLNIHLYDANKVFISAYNGVVDSSFNGSTSKKINIPSSIIPNVSYMRVTLRNSDNTSTITASEIETIKPQLEPGTKANSYTPYGTTPLEYCKIGDYEDEFVIPSGKQLFDKDSATRIYAYISGSTSWAYAQDSYSLRIPCKPNTNYVVNANNPNETIFRAGVTDSDNIPTSENVITLYSTTRYSNIYPIYLTTGENAKYIVIQFSQATASATLNTLMINEGTTALPYEPYNNGKWYLKKNIGKVVLNGSESGWGNRPSYIYADRFVKDNVFPTINKSMISNYFTISLTTADTYPYLTNSGRQCVINFSAKGTTSLADFKVWLSTHNTIVYYPLATPEYILLNDTLQSQLTEIYNWVLSYKDQTNISQVNNDLPFIINTITCYDLNKLLTRVEVLESEV